MIKFIVGFVIGLFVSWMVGLAKTRKTKSGIKVGKFSGSDDDVITNRERVASIEIPIIPEEPSTFSVDSTAPVAVEETSEHSVNAERPTHDDLTEISGIGPKINGLLEEAGIVNFGQLANADVRVFEGILKKAGSRFRLADPDDWANQARELMQQ